MEILKNTKMKITDLKPHPKNEEIYGYDEDIADLVERIRQSGQVHTLVINQVGYILAGHRRRRACMELGIKTVDVEIRQFSYPEEEVEFIINDNHYREKTVEQKAREAKALKEVESALGLKRKSILGATGGRGNKKDVPNSAHGLSEMEQGRSRDIVAKKVGLKSGHEVDRAIRAVETIDKLKENGRTEDAELIKGVLNNRSATAADELARNIDKVQIPDEDKILVKQGKKSPNKYVEKVKEKSRTKVCKECGRELPEENFYEGKGVCANCYNQRKKSRFFDASGNELKSDPEVIKNLVIPIEDAVASMKNEPLESRNPNYAVEFELFKENLDDYLFANEKFAEGSIFSDMPSDYIDMFQREVERLSQFISAVQKNLES